MGESTQGEIRHKRQKRLRTNLKKPQWRKICIYKRDKQGVARGIRGKPGDYSATKTKRRECFKQMYMVDYMGCY